MKYFLDCEFNGYRGALISLALVREDGLELYLAWPHGDFIPWVQDNVVTRICAGGTMPHIHNIRGWPDLIEIFMRDDVRPVVIADWPDDIRYFCECLITGPGEMIDIPPPERTSDNPLLTRRGYISFEVHRVDAYPTDLPGAVQHNALWDARALRHKLMGPHVERLS